MSSVPGQILVFRKRPRDQMAHRLRRLPKHPVALPTNTGLVDADRFFVRSAIRAPYRLQGVNAPQHEGLVPWSACATLRRMHAPDQSQRLPPPLVTTANRGRRRGSWVLTLRAIRA